MKTTLREIADKHWEARFPDLIALMDETLHRVENFLVLEDHYKGLRGEETRLSKSFGGFGSDVLDMKSLSTVLDKGYESKGMQKERSRRMRNIFSELESLRKAYQAKKPPVGHHELVPDVEAMLASFEEHIGGLSHLFRLIRMAQLEAKGRYSEEEHAAYFEEFSWRELDSGEMALCPPFLVYTTPREHFGEHLGTLIDLVTRGRPVKVVLSQAALSNGTGPGVASGESGRAAGLQSVPDAGLLFLSLRNVFFMQHSGSELASLEKSAVRGLDSPRPGVFSILADTESGDRHGNASLAVDSRAFPHFSYDPDRANDFVSCLDVSDNPAVDAFWSTRTLEYLDDHGEAASLERPYTPVDFAVDLARAKGERGNFKELDAQIEAALALPLVEFLEMTPAQRRGKTPFVYGVNEEGRLIRLAPSRGMVAKTADRLHVWHTLQELGGIGNPYVQAAEQRLRDTLAAENEAALEAQRAELEAQSREREQGAVSSALQALARRLTGQLPLAGENGFAAAGPGAAAPAAAAPIAAEGVSEAEVAVPAPAAPTLAPAPSGEEGPWVEQALCTSCDECTAINKKLFAYDGSKKAYILDPKGGPFSDIVKAAEKCSSGAIHPGAPLNPDEKDLEKWVKRAEKYQ